MCSLLEPTIEKSIVYPPLPEREKLPTLGPTTCRVSSSLMFPRAEEHLLGGEGYHRDEP